MTMRPTSQVYENYTEQDFQVWKILYERQIKLLQPILCADFLTAIKTVGFSPDRIPDFTEVNNILMPLTGWSLVTVPNISPQKDFFRHLSKKQFTATCWLRTMEQLDYLEEPDMFHDVFAHVPLLSNHAYCDFFKGISDIALEYIEHPQAIEWLGRIYWFTIEFGLIREADDFKIYGAGIISSAGETRHCINEEVEKIDFDVEKIFNTPYRTDILQDKYFVINSFGQLYSSLEEMRRILASELKPAGH